MDEIAAPLEGVRLAHASSSTATTCRRCSNAYDEARATKGRPTMILARTIKGKGLAAIEGKDGWHGKALKKGEEADQAIAELEKQMVPGDAKPEIQGPRSKSRPETRGRLLEDSAARPTRLGDQVATREAWGVALAAVGAVDPRIVALDADVKNSTFSDKFEKVAAGPVLRELHRRAGHGGRRHGAGGARRDSVSLHVRVLPHARQRLHPHGRRSRLPT